MDYYFKRLDLPAVPPGLLTEAGEVDRTVTSTGTHDRILTLRDGSNLPISRHLYQRFPVDVALQNWVRQNVIEQWCNIGVSHTAPPCLAPHMDRTRFYTLQYVIDRGGDHVQTVFYKAASEDLKIDPANLYFDDYRQLEPVASYTAQLGEWYLLNTRYIHSVENITGRRTLFQIGLMRDPWNERLLKVNMGT